MKPTNNYKSESERWQAVLRRDSQSDGAFFYAVQTTGIYCRPVCSSRLPNRKNVQFFDTFQRAEEAGFRPCKRCRPHDENPQSEIIDAVAQACRMIEEAHPEPTLNQLADAVGLSPSYFQRLFKKTVGVTPKQYAMQHKMDRVRSGLQEDSSITRAVYAAGYGASSRFYENVDASLGMKPSAYQKGGEGLVIRFVVVQSYLGWVLVALTTRGICRIDIDDDPDLLKKRLENTFPQAELRDDDPPNRAAIAQTLAFLEAPEGGLDLPLDVQGTAFQHRVWAALQHIPPGETATYAQVAGQIGSPKAARAVAQACATNKIAVAIPCHRVVKSNGALGGYRWGVDRKRVLLDREAEQKGGM